MSRALQRFVAGGDVTAGSRAQWTRLRSLAAGTPEATGNSLCRRCVPEKGLLEAAKATIRVLPQRPGWRARFVISEPDRNPDYRQQVEALLMQSEVNDRIEIERNIPWSNIKDRYEQAAIALVPSRWREPFGRTALEAHAGGAALISSGTGGLREVSGRHALYVDPADTESFAEAIRQLIDNEPLRTELANGGARRARKRFSIEAVAATNDAFYESLLTAKVAAPRAERPS